MLCGAGDRGKVLLGVFDEILAMSPEGIGFLAKIMEDIN